MNWLKLGRAFSWIDSRWLRITIILLAASTMLWMSVLGEGNFASKFFRGLFFSLQFIVLNKDIDPGIDPLPFSALTFAQFALPFTVSVALIGSLFQERMMPYWVRRAVAAVAVSAVMVVLQNQDALQALAGEQSGHVSLLQALSALAGG